MDELLKSLEEKDRKVFEAILKQMDTVKAEAQKGLITEAKLEEEKEALTKSINDLKAVVEGATYQEQLDNLTKSLEGLKGAQEVKQKGLMAEIKEALTPERIASLKDKKSIRFELKSIGTMSFTTHVSGTMPQAERIEGVNVIPLGESLIAGIIPAKPTTKNTIEYVVETHLNGDPVFLAELAEFEQLEIKYEVKDAKVRKIGSFIKVSREMLDDVDYMAAQISERLFRKIFLETDKAMMNGNPGGTNANEIKGLTVYAQAFDNDGFTVPAPNEIDVLSTAITQVLNNHHIPTNVWLHPSDVNAMKLTKNDNDSYVMPMLFLADGRKFDGLPIIENPRMNKGYFLVGDANMAEHYVKDGIEIEIAYENEDDFIKDIATVKGRQRLAFFVKENDTDAFVYGKFSTAITAMTPKS